MNKVIINSPTLADVDTLWMWGQENWELWGDPETKWYTKESLRIWIQNPRDDVLLVARISDSLVGLCFTCNLRSWSYCAGLYVDKAYRKLGLGKQLVEKTSELMFKKGIREIVFLADLKNKSGIDFYRKVGCKEGFKFLWMYKSFKKE